MMTSSAVSASGLLLRALLLLLAAGLHAARASCNFPDAMVMARDDPPWYTHVTHDGARTEAYYVRRTVLEIHFPTAAHDRPFVRWKCVMDLDGKLLLRRQDHFANKFYRCVQFLARGPSVVQAAWSEESKVLDIALCDQDLLRLDPWPLVRYHTMEADFSDCPFSGGYDMKVTDSRLGENGCNLMHRPMRLEVACVGGEGVIFDFTSSNCVPDVKMHSRQRTLCVASWHHDGNHFSILRRRDDTTLWCLVVPVHRGTEVRAYLFSDLACQGDDAIETVKSNHEPSNPLKYFVLDLHQRNFPTLCEDEYSQCASVECNDYFKQECQKSCGACNGTSHIEACLFPKRFKGSWFLKNSADFRHVEMKSSEMAIQGVGRFQCALFPDSPARKSRVYTTVSVYDNGCRPRYSCIKLLRLGPSVIRYSLSQSYEWPSIKADFGKKICEEDRFQADQAPIEDFYRSHFGSGKPIISQNPSPVPVHCNLSAVLTIIATLPEGFVCSGTMFTHCEDPTKLRMYFGSCSGLIEMSTDYQCLANYEGHYWERILLVQNVKDEADAMCFVFNRFKPNEAYVMVAGQCDQESFNFARAGVRKPRLSLKFREESERCQPVPVTTLAPKTVTKDDDRPLAPHHSSSYSNRTHADQGHLDQPGSVVVTLAPLDKSDHKTGGTGKAVSQSKTDTGSSGHAGSNVRACPKQWGLVLLVACVYYLDNVRW